MAFIIPTLGGEGLAHNLRLVQKRKEPVLRHYGSVDVNVGRA